MSDKNKNQYGCIAIGSSELRYLIQWLGCNSCAALHIKAIGNTIKYWSRKVF